MMCDSLVHFYCCRYGSQVGLATENAMYAVGNTFLSAHNITQLGPKAIAKRAAKDTAKAVVNPAGTNTSAPHQANGTPPQTPDVPALGATEPISGGDPNRKT